jgi:hypothetical protein
MGGKGRRKGEAKKGKGGDGGEEEGWGQDEVIGMIMGGAEVQALEEEAALPEAPKTSSTSHDAPTPPCASSAAGAWADYEDDDGIPQQPVVRTVKMGLDEVVLIPPLLCPFTFPLFHPPLMTTILPKMRDRDREREREREKHNTNTRNKTDTNYGITNLALHGERKEPKVQKTSTQPNHKTLPNFLKKPPKKLETQTLSPKHCFLQVRRMREGENEAIAEGELGVPGPGVIGSAVGSNGVPSSVGVGPSSGGGMSALERKEKECGIWRKRAEQLQVGLADGLGFSGLSGGGTTRGCLQLEP